jgi:hypothetical protein
MTNYAKWHHVPIQEVAPTQMEIGQTPAEATPQPTQNEVPDEEMTAATKEQNPLRQRKPLALIVVAIWSMFVSTCSVVFPFFVARAAVLAL